MKKLLWVLIILIMSTGITYAQGFLGKNKTQAKKELLTGGGRVSDIKSFGYDGYIHITPKSVNMYGVLFNKKGICFLEFLTKSNGLVVDQIISHLCNNSSNHVYRIDPNISKEHEFIEGKTTIELVVEPDVWCFYIFQSKYKQDVLDYFEKRYHEEYLNIEEKKQKEEKEKSMQAWRQQEQIRRVKEIENALFMVNKEKIKSTASSFLNNKLLEWVKSLDVRASQTPKRREIYPVAKVLVHFDSLSTDVVEINGEIVDSDLIKLFESASKYCKIDTTDYYKYQNHIFYEEYIKVQRKPLEKGVCGVRNRNGHYKYYRDTPHEVQEWCQKNITGNDFHAIEYINCDGQYTIQTIAVNKELKKIIQGKDPRKIKDPVKARRIWSSIGGAVLLGGLLGLSVL